MTDRDALPQLEDRIFLTDGGIETTLIHHQGIELPDFAAFVLHDDETGRGALRRYFEPYAVLARDAGLGLVLETATWRASRDWGDRLGYSRAALAEANRASVDVARGARARSTRRSRARSWSAAAWVPRGDGYDPERLLETAEAEDYHSEQVATFAETEADLVTAITMTHTGEAIGSRAGGGRATDCRASSPSRSRPTAGCRRARRSARRSRPSMRRRAEPRRTTW